MMPLHNDDSAMVNTYLILCIVMRGVHVALSAAGGSHDSSTAPVTAPVTGGGPGRTSRAALTVTGPVSGPCPGRPGI